MITISRLEAEFTDELHNWYEEGKCLSTTGLCSSKQISVSHRHHTGCDKLAKYAQK